MGSSDRNEGGGGVERPVLGCGLVAAEMAGWTRKGGDALRVASGLGWAVLWAELCRRERQGPNGTDQGGPLLRSVRSVDPVPVDRSRS